MQKILKWLTPLIAVGVAIFIVFFLISINSKGKFVETEPLVLNSQVVIQKPEKVWLEHFSKSEKFGYSYPVNEVYVKVNLKEKITKTITYKLYAKILDPYQLFCLKEELKNHKLKYHLKKENTNVVLFIYSRDVNKLNKLVKILKDYKITAKVMSYKEEY